jgi:hypothetical protein
MRQSTVQELGLVTAPEEQGRIEEAMAIRAKYLELGSGRVIASRELVYPPTPDLLPHRFGRMIHPRSWST